MSAVEKCTGCRTDKKKCEKAPDDTRGRCRRCVEKGRTRCDRQWPALRNPGPADAIRMLHSPRQVHGVEQASPTDSSSSGYSARRADIYGGSFITGPAAYEQPRRSAQSEYRQTSQVYHQTNPSPASGSVYAGQSAAYLSPPQTYERLNSPSLMYSNNITRTQIRFPYMQTPDNNQFSRVIDSGYDMSDLINFDMDDDDEPSPSFQWSQTGQPDRSNGRDNVRSRRQNR